jgi:hypothetical protein
MQKLEIRTKLFSTDQEGAREHCNGKPGSQLDAWLRNKLTERGHRCSEITQEDYGWGFHIRDQDLDIWVTVGLMDEQVDDIPQWGILAEHDAPFKPLQWFKKREGKVATDTILADIKTVIAGEPSISIADES